MAPSVSTGLQRATLAQAPAPGLPIAAEGISLTFGGLSVLRDVSFAAHRAQITAIIGPNGAGKTSLFNTISGFYRPARGEHPAGRTQHHPHAGARTRRARPGADVPEHRAVPRPVGAREHQAWRPPHHEGRRPVGDGLRAQGAAPRSWRCATKSSARSSTSWRSTTSGTCRSTSLAYGLQKRVELARALAMRPRVLLLDEPVAGMNREETEDMARFILDVQEEWGVTVLLVEHDMGMVMDISQPRRRAQFRRGHRQRVRRPRSGATHA